jgi:hypothetical protein
MTQSEYDLLMQNAEPHQVFELGWGSYSSANLAATFLPKITPVGRTFLKLYDGAGIFQSTVHDEFMKIDFSSNALDINVFSFPKDAMIGSNLMKTVPLRNELNIFFEVSIDDSVQITTIPGSNFFDQLRLVTSKNQLKTKFKSSISEINDSFSYRVSHTDILSYVLSKGGVEILQSESDVSFKEIEEALKGLDFDFDAGEVRSASNPDSWGHGDIEFRALKDVFKEHEIEQIYYGNWLRDYSSIITASTVGFNPPDIEIFRTNSELKDLSIVTKNRPKMGSKFSQFTWSRIVKVMAVQEFTYKRKKGTPSENYFDHKGNFEKRFGDMSIDILGVYRPEEHIDNPKGQLDESVFAHPKLVKPVQYNYEYDKGKFKKLKLYKGEQSASLEIDLNGMKSYIKKDFTDRPSSLTFVKEQLRLAKRYGRNMTGLRHFGAALHVMEDYFAHTNFVEISLIKNGYLDVYPWVELSDSIKSIDDGPLKALNIPLVTGLFGGDDVIASLTPKIANEFFPKGIQEYKKLNKGDRTFFDVLMDLILNDYIEKDSELPDHKKSKFPGTNYNYQEIKNAYHSYLGLRDKWLEIVNNPYTGTVAELLDRLTHRIGQSLKFYPYLMANAMLSSTSDGIKHKQSQASGYGDNPSHTQLAKDPVDHHLNPLAGKLAYIVVKEVGKQMKEVWAGTRTVESLIENVEVDLFDHPVNIIWTDNYVKEWAKANPSAIKKAKSRTIVEHYDQLINKRIKLTKEEYNELIDALLNSPN